ncbi:MAG: SufE family protein [Opitutaceae bacterium]|jgi:cysteine desulfuration protein SufE|nr:SufE family protein [Opitutaceae bacterium]
MTVADNEQTLLDEFHFIENPQERLGAIVDATRQLPHFPEADRSDDNHVKGCTSQVWLVAENDGDVWQFKSDCDSPLVRALVHLLCRCFDGVSAEEAKTVEITVLDQLGVTRNLTPTRLNGLAAVRARIATLASRTTGNLND